MLLCNLFLLLGVFTCVIRTIDGNSSRLPSHETKMQQKS